jgi:hypothetical protein
LTTKTKQILAIEVTKEDIGDGRMLRRLVDGPSSEAGLKGVVADCAYDSESNFRMLADRGIDSLMRVRKEFFFKGWRLYASQVRCRETVGQC